MHATCPGNANDAFEQFPRQVPGLVEAEDFDPEGYMDSSEANEGMAYRTDTSVDIKSIDSGYAIGWMTAGEYLEYTVDVETEGEYDVVIRSGAVGTGRTLRITQCDQVLLNSFTVPNVADWGQMKTWSAGKITLKPGLQKIRVEVSGVDYLDLDWIHIGEYTGELDGEDEPATPDNPAPQDPTFSAGCGTNRTLQNGSHNINVDGTNRSYILRVPDNYNNETPYRLIFAYHWRSGNANQVASGGNGGSTEDPFYGLWDLANNSTIFVAPEGINAGWENSGGRDVRFTDEMLKQIQNGFCIDNSRIFATGFSYGAGMSNALACARANVFRGVALYAGAQISGCDGGTTPIAYFGAHGIGDSVLNVSTGRSLRDRFANNNGCDATNAPEPAQGSGTHICTSYTGCAEGYPVRWCAFDGDHNPTEKDRGQSKSWVPGEAWQFISQF